MPAGALTTWKFPIWDPLLLALCVFHLAPLKWYHDVKAAVEKLLSGGDRIPNKPIVKLKMH